MPNYKVYNPDHKPHLIGPETPVVSFPEEWVTRVAPWLTEAQLERMSAERMTIEELGEFGINPDDVLDHIAADMSFDPNRTVVPAAAWIAQDPQGRQLVLDVHLAADHDAINGAVWRRQAFEFNPDIDTWSRVQLFEEAQGIGFGSDRGIQNANEVDVSKWDFSKAHFGKCELLQRIPVDFLDADMLGCPVYGEENRHGRLAKAREIAIAYDIDWNQRDLPEFPTWDDVVGYYLVDGERSQTVEFVRGKHAIQVDFKNAAGPDGKYGMSVYLEKAGDRYDHALEAHDCLSLADAYDVIRNHILETMDEEFRGEPAPGIKTLFDGKGHLLARSQYFEPEHEMFRMKTPPSETAGGPVMGTELINDGLQKGAEMAAGDYADGVAMKACVGNYGSYTAGYLIDQWFDLPMPDDMLEKRLGEMRAEAERLVGTPCEEFYISDYDGHPIVGGEGVFNEHVPIEELNLMAKQLVTMDEAQVEAANAYMAFEGNLSFDQAMNVLLQADEVPYFDYEWVGYTGSDPFMQAIHDSLSNEYKYGSSCVENNPALKELLENDPCMDSAFDYEEYGRQVAMAEGVKLLDGGYLLKEDVCLDYYGHDEIAEAVIDNVRRWDPDSPLAEWPGQEPEQVPHVQDAPAPEGRTAQKQKPPREGHRLLVPAEDQQAMSQIAKPAPAKAAKNAPKAVR